MFRVLDDTVTAGRSRCINGAGMERCVPAVEMGDRDSGMRDEV